MAGARWTGGPTGYIVAAGYEETACDWSSTKLKKMSQKHATAIVVVACSVILLTVGYVALHDMSQHASPTSLLESSLKQLVRRLWAGGNNKLAQQRHRKNLELLGARHKSIRSQLRKTLSLNAADSIKADVNTATVSPHVTGLYAGPRRIRGFCGGPSKPAGMIMLASQRV